MGKQLMPTAKRIQSRLVVRGRFHRWLEEQYWRTDEVGEIALIVRLDVSWPEADSVSDQQRYARHRWQAHRPLRRALIEYFSQVEHSFPRRRRRRRTQKTR